MQRFRETVYIESNPSTGCWEIPVYTTGFESSNVVVASQIEVNVFSDKYWDRESSALADSGYIKQWYSDTDTSYILSDPLADLWVVRIPSSITFKTSDTFDDYLYVCVKVYDLSDTDWQTPLALYEFTLRRAVASSGGGSGNSAPTAAEVATAVWNYSVANPSTGTLGTRTLSSTVEVDPDDIAEAVWNYAVAEPASGTLGTRTLSSSVEVDSDDIAEAVWNYGNTSTTIETRTLTASIPTAADIASTVLTTNVGSMAVNSNEYTIKHLIMASQKSEFLVNNNEPHQATWTITDTRTSNGEPVVIASRTLTLNDNGAIVKTA